VLRELQAVTEGLAARLQRDVAIDDPRMRLLAHTAHHGLVDKARTESILRLQAPSAVVGYVVALGLDRARTPVVRVPPAPELELLARVCAPLRAGGELLGYLWLIDADESLTEEDLEVVTETAQSAAMVLQRDRLLDDLRAGRERELVRDLLSDDAGVRTAAAGALTALDEPQTGPARVVVINVPAGVDLLAGELIAEVDRALDRVARNLVPRRCLRLARVDHGLLVVPLGPGRRDNSRDVAAAARAELQRILGGAEVRSGVGDRVADLSEVVNSYRQARRAVRVSEVVPGFGPDVAWSDLGVYRILVHLPLDELPEDAIPPALLALLDSPSGREIIRTVEVYLDHAGDAKAAVDALKVHRTTLYYRLGRFAELTGLDLSDGGDRLAIHVGLKLARLAGSYTP
jgi:hypothetical protein